MELLYIEGGIVKPTPEILQISVFKEIWDRDKSLKKEQALVEFTYIKFMLYPIAEKNPFYDYPIEIRSNKIIESLSSSIDPNDELIISGLAQYEEQIEKMSISKKYLDAVMEGAEKMIMFLKSVNFNERDNKGSAVYKPSDVDRVLKSCTETLKSIQGMKKMVREEMYESIKTRSNRTVNRYEKRKENR